MTVYVRRGWLALAMAGCALVAIALAVVFFVIVDKKHFGWLVGPLFLPVMTSGIYAGALMLLIGTWKLPVRRDWRGIVLFAWAAIALASPLFGIMFLLPWGALVVMLPVVLWILYSLYRTAPREIAIE